jgi:hypothetical protein
MHDPSMDATPRDPELLRLLKAEAFDQIRAPFSGRLEGSMVFNLALGATTVAIAYAWRESPPPLVVMLLYWFGVGVVAFHSVYAWRLWRRRNRARYHMQALRGLPLGVQLGVDLTLLVALTALTTHRVLPPAWQHHTSVIAILGSACFVACLIYKWVIEARFRYALTRAVREILAANKSQASG